MESGGKSIDAGRVNLDLEACSFYNLCYNMLLDFDCTQYIHVYFAFSFLTRLFILIAYNICMFILRFLFSTCSFILIAYNTYMSILYFYFQHASFFQLQKTPACYFCILPSNMLFNKNYIQY